MIKLGTRQISSNSPKICIPLAAETINDIICQCHIIQEHAFDFVEFKASKFNGCANLSQLWNAVMAISMQLTDAPWFLSCRFSELPSYYQTEKDYHNIITFAIRSGFPDAVEIDTNRNADTVSDAVDLALDIDMTPILLIEAENGASKKEIVLQLENNMNPDVEIYHLNYPVQTPADITVMKQAATFFTAAHPNTAVIVEPVGTIGRKALADGDTFDSPIVYASPLGANADYTDADALAKKLNKS